MNTMKKRLKAALIRLIADRTSDGFVTQIMLRRRVLGFRKDESLFSEKLFGNGDPVRYATLALLLYRLDELKIPGSIAEVGVWQGRTSAILHDLAAARELFLFDTFEGFPQARDDARFQDTSIETVKRNIGDLGGVHIIQGIIPASLAKAKDERFAFVLLDLDKQAPTVESLRFFYPRLSNGGFIMLHDYNSPESDWAIRKAIDEFSRECRPFPSVVYVPDRWGSAILCKNESQA